MDNRISNHHLPSWKKTPDVSKRGVRDDTLETHMSTLILECDKKEVKELLCKVKILDNHDTKVKTLCEFNVKTLQETV